MDITYQSISTILRRLENEFPGQRITDDIVMDGIPRDLASARALANKRDDRLRKEFEKWAVLTYTNNRAAINEKKGADAGIDGTAYFWRTKTATDKVVLQVKSGNVERGDIAKLRGDVARENAAIGVMITLDDPTQPMKNDAKHAGMYADSFTARKYDCLQIVTIQEIVEQGKRIELPLTVDVQKVPLPVAAAEEQVTFELRGADEPKKSRKMVKASLPLGFQGQKLRPVKRTR